MEAITASARYQSGDLEADADFYRIHVKMALPRPEHMEVIIGRLRSNATAEGVRAARAIEDRLYQETRLSPNYDLVPRLRHLRMPTLVLHGHHDFIPGDLAAHIAGAISGAVLRVLPGCGHFAFLEEPELVQEHVAALLDIR